MLQPEEQWHCLELIRDSGHALLNSANDILISTKLEARHFTFQNKRFNLLRIAYAVIEILEPYFRKDGIALRHDYFDGLHGHFLANPGCVRQI